MNRGLLVQQVLNKLRLTQREFAIILKVNPSAVSKWISGTDYLRDERVFQLKYYVDKNIGREASNIMFAPILKEIEG